MRHLLARAAFASALLISTAAAAQTAAAPQSAAATPQQPRPGDLIKTADGLRVGRIDSIETAKDGSAYARVIYEMRLVRIPVATLTPGPQGYVTSVKRRELDDLK